MLRWVEVSSVGEAVDVAKSGGSRRGMYGMTRHGIAWGGEGDKKRERKGKDWKVSKYLTQL